MALYKKIIKQEVIEKEEYKCEFCDYVFNDEDDLRYHIGEKHAVKKELELDLNDYNTIRLYYIETEELALCFIYAKSQYQGDYSLDWTGVNWYVVQTNIEYDNTVYYLVDVNRYIAELKCEVNYITKKIDIIEKSI